MSPKTCPSHHWLSEDLPAQGLLTSCPMTLLPVFAKQQMQLTFIKQWTCLISFHHDTYVVISLVLYVLEN